MSRWSRYAVRLLGSMMLLPVLMPAAYAAEPGIQSTQARLKTSYETLKLPGNERMGLLGAGFLYQRNDWLSLGPAFYGALSGRRGGLITLGLAADLHQDLGQYLALEGGLFVGAGGGHGGLQLSGGGLMLRAHAGVLLKGGSWGNLGGGASYVTFPNGSIHSAQPYVTYEYPFKTWMVDGWLAQPEAEAGLASVPATRQEAAFVYRHYAIPGGVLTSTGTPQHASMQLMGIEWQRYVHDDFFLKVESEGAMGGNSNGYMQILMGGGYRLALTGSTAIKLSASVGVAGGGSVATGGGLLLDGSLALQQYLGNDLYVEAAGGYVDAPGASFRATSISGKLGYRLGTPDSDADSLPLSALAGYERRHFRLRLTHQTYFRANPQWRRQYVDRNVNLLGFQGDYFISPYVYATGQGIAAYQGKAGAYMTGLIGGGLHLPLGESPLFAEAEMLVGAAGGGGMNVGGGLVWQANAGLGYRIADAYSLIAMYGRITAPKGSFRANVLSVSLAHRFTLFGQ